MSLQQETDSFIQQKTEWRWGRLFLCLQLTNSLKVNFKVEIERSLFVLHSCFSNEIEATLNRLKKLEKDLTVKEKELREVWVVFFLLHFNSESETRLFSLYHASGNWITVTFFFMAFTSFRVWITRIHYLSFPITTQDYFAKLSWQKILFIVNIYCIFFLERNTYSWKRKGNKWATITFKGKITSAVQISVHVSFP